MTEPAGAQETDQSADRVPRLRTVLILPLSAWLAAQAGAAPQSKSLDQFRCAHDLLDRGEYLKAADLFEAAKAGEEAPYGPLHQTAGTVLPFVTGQPDESLAPRKVDPADLRQLSSAQLRDAITEIVKRARQTNIVILNEEHLAPRDRAFGLQVARALRPLGYSFLGAEDFASSSDPAVRQKEAQALANDGYPRLKSGFYIRDPVFGDFVRQSLALGYRPIVYEYIAPGTPRETPSVAVRDEGEAENLVHALFSKNPKTKVLIYVGYAHAAETPAANSEWLAERLKKLTGVDPLTIDQTTLSPTGDSGLYTAVSKRMHGRSVVPLLDGKPLKFGYLGGSVDLQVAHPPVRLLQSRPDWLARMGRKPVAVPARLMPSSGLVLVQAFLANEAEDAVPIDQVIVTAGHKPPPLMIPPRPVRFRVRTGFEPGDCEPTPAK